MFSKYLQTWMVFGVLQVHGWYEENGLNFILADIDLLERGETKAAALPVPFFARARISRLSRAIGIDSSWMGDGFSNPASKMSLSSSRLRNISCLW